MPRFLHTADWQIGRQYSRFAKDDAVALAEARFSAVERIAALAQREAVDAVLVAGDVFDAQTVSDRTIRRLFNVLAGFRGPWILLPGNHDAALAESVWQRAQRLQAVPDHVVLALQAEPLYFNDLGFAVLPAPLTQRNTYDDLTAWFDQANTPPNLLRLGLAHGSVQGILAEDIDSANPIASDRAERARLDYLALGDWHGTRQINPRCWYSGTPEPERFRGNDPGNVLLVDIAAPGAEPQIAVHRVGQHPWLQWEARIDVASDLEQLVERLQQAPEQAVLDLRLSGSLDLASHQVLNHALSVAEARYRSLSCDQSALKLLPSEADIAGLHADGYLGAVIAELQAAQESEDGEVAREALGILARLLLDQQARRAQP
jgi:DNA repair exonuclease SbcCD nuclease subunit